MVQKKNPVMSVSIVLAVVSIIFIAVSFNMNAYGQNEDTNVAVDIDLNKLKITHAGGGFSSLQTDADNKTWVTGGKWDLQSAPLNSTANSSGIGFNASIDMRGTDNSADHSHKVSDFKLAKMSVDSTDEGSTLTFNGTATIETPVGLTTDVPIRIRLIDSGQVFLSSNSQSGIVEPKWVARGGVISLAIDQKINDHFGSTPVYGSIRKE